MSLPLAKDLSCSSRHHDGSLAILPAASLWGQALRLKSFQLLGGVKTLIGCSALQC